MKDAAFSRLAPGKEEQKTKIAYMAIKLIKTKERAMRKKTAPPCNEDCFNCIYPDCIFDGLGRETKAADDKPKDPSQMSRSMRYYYSHQEEQCAHKRAFYAEHKEEINARRAQRAKEKRAAKAAGDK